MAVTLSELKPGDVLTYWSYIDKAQGSAVCFARVEKVGAKTVRVVTPSGEAAWKRPEFFIRRLTDEQAAGVRAEGVNV